MKKVLLLMIGIIILDSCYGANLRNFFRIKRAESDFILRSCIASAQLARGDLTVGRSNLPKLTSASLVLNNSNNLNSRNELKLITRAKARTLREKSTTDTPLGTVDVKPVRKEHPKQFVKKDPLPELDKNGTVTKVDSETPIIVVQSINH